jgi:tRNA 2-thiouridine synthesizing protein A
MSVRVIQIDLELDTSGLNCPLPLLRLKKALQSMDSGQVVRVLATDPAAVLDFGVFLEQAGHVLLERERTEGLLQFVIRKG